jgi:environmental stress-induced protein Ves
MNVVRLADVTPQPWRNGGGGSTRALLAWPNADNWQVRVSVATIAADGDFSAWPDTERWFAVIEGAGVKLALPDGDVTLLSGDPPHRFAGDAAPGCKLIAGPTQDLNLMVRHDFGIGEMRRAFAGSRASGIAAWRGLYAADALTLELDGAVMPVAAGTLLWLATDQPVGWQVHEGDARAWWLSWRPR